MAKRLNDARPRCEGDLYDSLVQLFRHYTHAFAEVPLFGKHIDLVFATRTLLWLCAVETKLRDWRGAFKQAALNQLAAQHSYVAVPGQLALRLADRERRLFTSYDVGLISVDGGARILIPPTRNGYFNSRHYRTLKRTLIGASRIQKPQKMGALSNALTKRSRTLVLIQARAH